MSSSSEESSPDFRLVAEDSNNGDYELKFECLVCADGTVVTDPDRHALFHGKQKYTVDSATAARMWKAANSTISGRVFDAGWLDEITIDGGAFDGKPREVPLYIGEGENRIEAGTAEVSLDGRATMRFHGDRKYVGIPEEIFEGDRRFSIFPKPAFRPFIDLARDSPYTPDLSFRIGELADEQLRAQVRKAVEQFSRPSSTESEITTEENNGEENKS